LDGRTVSLEGYRFGLNAQEKTDEISGSGNHTTALYWEYDPRIAKRWNTDPVVKHHESPFACFANNPIWFTDFNGADSVKVGDNWYWKVKHGDDYAKISARTGVKFVDLKQWNIQDPLDLKSGTLLNLQNNGNVHFVYEEKTPTIYRNTLNGLAQHPEWTSLNYMYPRCTPGNTNNRKEVCPPGSCTSGTSCDEFPFASTIQGGYGAVTMCVPTREQYIQGQQLGMLYRKMNIGESFLVIPVPENKKPPPEALPLVNPYYKPYVPKYITFDPKKIKPVGGPAIPIPIGLGPAGIGSILKGMEWILTL
jgi:hypothetical protein